VHLPAEAVRTLLVFTVLAGASLTGWRPLVRRTGWAPAPALLMCLSLALCLAMTLPDAVGAGAADRLGTCVRDPAAHMARSVRAFGARGLEDVMNVALWVPPGFFGVLAARRPAVATVVIAGSFVLVEFLQTLDPGRECDPGDWAYNTSGVVIGALAALAGRRLRRPARRWNPDSLS
jgi:hypothetical protein